MGGGDYHALCIDPESESVLKTRLAHYWNCRPPSQARTRRSSSSASVIVKRRLHGEFPLPPLIRAQVLIAQVL